MPKPVPPPPMLRPPPLAPEVKEARHQHELEKDCVKDLDIWEQQNTQNELNFYAANLQAKIRNSVTNKKYNSPRLNCDNLNLITTQGASYQTLGYERLKLKDFNKDYSFGEVSHDSGEHYFD